MNAIGDVVWPANYLGGRLVTLWPISVGLVIELFFVRWLTRFGWGKAILADILMNAVSTLVGSFLIVLAGLAWEFTGGIIVNFSLGLGTFNPITWAATFVIAVFINAALESAVLRYIFKQRPFNRLFWCLSVANAFSVAVALVGIFLYPPRT